MMFQKSSPSVLISTDAKDISGFDFYTTFGPVKNERLLRIEPMISNGDIVTYRIVIYDQQKFFDTGGTIKDEVWPPKKSVKEDKAKPE